MYNVVCEYEFTSRDEVFRFVKVANEGCKFMRVTQRDIARIADVSQATVSRVLAGDARVEEAIRCRVVDVMRQQNYQPDVRARALRSKRAGLIGLVIKRPQGGISNDPFFAALIASILDQLSGTPYHLCIDQVSNESSHEAIYDEMLRTRRVDGLILVESEARDERIERLQQDSFPFVLIGNPLHFGEVLSVDNDNVYAGELVTRHLVEQGFTRIGFLGGRQGVTVSDDRIAGYQRAIRGVQNQHLIWHSEFGLEPAKAAAHEILSSPDRPDALVVLDDYMSMGLILAARQCGLRIPQDLAIASFNDTSFCQFIDGGLTSVSLNIGKIVAESCKRLLASIEGKANYKEPRSIIPVELKVRESSRRESEVK